MTISHSDLRAYHRTHTDLAYERERSAARARINGLLDRVNSNRPSMALKTMTDVLVASGARQLPEAVLALQDAGFDRDYIIRFADLALESAKGE